MKITLNLATPPSPHERYGLAWAIPTVFVALVGMGLLAFFARRNYRDYRAVHRSVLEMQQREAELRSRESSLRRELEQPQFREVYRQANFVNALIDQKQFSLTELMQKVSNLLPGEARLTSLVLPQGGKEPVVRFAVVGNSEEAIEAFLSNLEDSSDFADVAILNQGFAQESGTEGSVAVVCMARYLGARPRGGLDK
jgi:Tfp pilus assembly protein PilN